MNAPDRSVDKLTGETQERPVRAAESVHNGNATDGEKTAERRTRHIPAARGERGLAPAHTSARKVLDDGHANIANSSSSSGVVEQAMLSNYGSKQARSTKRKRVGSVADLISGWYGNAKKKTLKAPTKAEMRAISTAWRLDESQERHLVKLASVDRTLDKTRQLLLLIVGMQEGAVASTMQGFAKLVLQKHPVFHTPSFTGIFRDTDAAPNPNDVLDERDVAKLVHLIMSNELRRLFTTEELGRKRKGELARCRHNAVCCTLIWLYLTEQIRLGKAVDCVREHIWTPAVGRNMTESEMLRTVMSARDVAAAGVASMLLEAQLRDQAASVSAARAAERRAAERAGNADAKLAEVRGQLVEALESNGILKKQLERERGERADETAAGRDEYQQLRGGVLRRLREEVSMLEDGLRALKRDPPKVGVMVDHGERVLDGLRREIERLRR